MEAAKERNLSETQNNDETVGDDGLTARERELITTPISELPKDAIKFGMAMLENRAEHNWRENEEYRRNQEETRERLA